MSDSGEAGVTPDRPGAPSLLVLERPGEDAIRTLKSWATEGPQGLLRLAEVAGADCPLADEAAALFGSALERATPDETATLLLTTEPERLRAVLIAIGKSGSERLLELVDEHEPDVVAQYMMLLDWADDDALLDLVDVLGTLRSAMSIWSLEEIAQRFPGEIGDKSKGLLGYTEEDWES